MSFTPLDVPVPGPAVAGAENRIVKDKNSSWTSITPREYASVGSYIQETLPPNAIIGMLDMDAFEVQIYLNKMGVGEGRDIYLHRPTILADPSTDRIVSVNYLAKAKGITREDRIGGAKEKCPEVFVIRKKVRFDKPENLSLRHASWEVLDAICKFRKENDFEFVVEYASNDNFYFDLTRDVDELMANEEFMEELDEAEIGRLTFMENTDTTAGSNEIIDTFHELRGSADPQSQTLLRLILGSVILADIRNKVFEYTDYEGSGGVGVNKLLAKLATPIHKPGGITILPQSGLLRVSAAIAVEKLPSLGGERGKILQESTRVVEEGCNENGENLGVGMTVKDLATLPFCKLVSTTSPSMSMGEKWTLRNLARGAFTDPVVEKAMNITATVGRANLRGLRFQNNQRIHSTVYILVGELMERVTEEERRHKRVPQSIQAGLSYIEFPRNEEERGQPPTVVIFEYLFDPGAEGLAMTSSKSNDDLVNTVLIDLLETVKGKRGVIVKINFMIKAFNEVVNKM